MAGLTYDTGALLAAEANDRRVWAIHRRALERSHLPTVASTALAQAWRGGPQPLLSRLLEAVTIDPLDESAARLTGALLARAGRADVVDASVVVGALRRGDAVLTSDRDDLTALADAAGRRLDVIPI
jgi:predicted nucleic acid-binding protein